MSKLEDAKLEWVIEVEKLLNTRQSKFAEKLSEIKTLVELEKLLAKASQYWNKQGFELDHSLYYQLGGVADMMLRKHFQSRRETE